jgi:hypothetical protein
LININKPDLGYSQWCPKKSSCKTDFKGAENKIQVKEIKMLQRYPEKSPCKTFWRSHRSSWHLPPPSRRSQRRRATPANTKNGHAPGCPSRRAPVPCPDPNSAPSRRRCQALRQAPGPCPSRRCREDLAPTRTAFCVLFLAFTTVAERLLWKRTTARCKDVFLVSCSAIFCWSMLRCYVNWTHVCVIMMSWY